MSENNKSMVVSLALWSEKPPLNDLSALIFIPSANILVTGSDNGNIVVWQFMEDLNLSIKPLFYLIGHKSKITNLIYVADDKVSKLAYVVSFSMENEIGLWEVTTGRNIEFLTNIPWNIITVKCHEVAQGKQKLLLCCLKSPEIIVLSSISLTILCSLVCSSSPNWFSAVTSMNTRSKDNVVIGSTRSGTICMWVIDFAALTTATFVQDIPAIEADQCVDIQISDPLKVCYNTLCPAVVMVISGNKMKIFHAKNWELLCYLDSRRHDYFIDGEFIGHDCILLHTERGRSIFYHLPNRANCRHSEFGMDSSSLIENIPNLVTEFEPHEASFDSHKICSGQLSNKYVLIKGLRNGSIIRYDLTNGTDIVRHIVLTPADMWKMKPTNSNGLHNFVKSVEKESTNLIVTSLILMSELSLVAVGMSTGRIYVTTITNMLSGIFILDSYRDNSDEYFYLDGHDGPVLSLLHPTSVMKLPHKLSSSMNSQSKACLHLLKLTHLLWSGGADYSIRVWNMKSAQCLFIFYCHSSPVVLLKINYFSNQTTNSLNETCGFSQGFTAAMFNCISDQDEHKEDIKQMISMCMNCFVIAISENDSISVISMMKRKLLMYSSVHNAPIRNLGWLLNSGYLLIETMDYKVFVWDLSTSTLDRVECNQTAQNLMESCPMITRIHTRYCLSAFNSSTKVRRHALTSSGPWYIKNSVITTSTTSNLPNGQSETNVKVAMSDKFIKVHFLNTQSCDKDLVNELVKNKDSYSYLIPVLTFDIGLLIESLDDDGDSLNWYYQSLCEIPDDLAEDKDITIVDGSDSCSDFDNIMLTISKKTHKYELKFLLVKILLALTCNIPASQNISDSKSILSNIEKYIDINSVNTRSISFGTANTKTGCAFFDLRNLTPDPPESLENNNLINLSITDVNELILHLSIINRIIQSNFSAKIMPTSSSFFLSDSADDDCDIGGEGRCTNENSLHTRPKRKMLRRRKSNNNSPKKQFNKAFRDYRRNILFNVIPNWFQLFTISNDENIPIYCIEAIFSQLISGIIDSCEIINKSSLQLINRITGYLSAQQLQTYILVWRMFLYPNLDYHNHSNTIIKSLQQTISSSIGCDQQQSHGLTILIDHLAHINQHYYCNNLASDWIWWWSSKSIDSIKSDDATNDNSTHPDINKFGSKVICYHKYQSLTQLNLTCLQINGLLNLAIIGSHISEDADTINGHGCALGNQELQLFTKVFSLDNYFLARITCDFMCAIINCCGYTEALVNLIRMMIGCISRGFCTWEPYLDSNNLIVKLLMLSVGISSNNVVNCNNKNNVQNNVVPVALEKSANKALYTIAIKRPLVFIMVCYREMLRQINNQSHSHSTNSSGSSPAMRRMSSTPVFSNTESLKPNINTDCGNMKLRPVLPIIDFIIESNPPQQILNVLPEIVELYIYITTKILQKFDIISEMHLFAKFPSICINPRSGHVSVGASNGSLVLIDMRSGKYFNSTAHKRSVTLTQFSDDNKHVVSYSIDENMMKIWQITNSSIFHLGHALFQVKMINSHALPSIEQMIAANSIVNKATDFAEISLKIDSNKVRLEWQADKSINIKYNESVLKKILLK